MTQNAVKVGERQKKAKDNITEKEREFGEWTVSLR